MSAEQTDRYEVTPDQVTDEDRANYPGLDDETIARELSSENEIAAVMHGLDLTCTDELVEETHDDVIATIRAERDLPPLEQEAA